MSRFEASVFDKDHLIEAIRYCREVSGEFFETEVMCDGAKETVYIVSVSPWAAQQELVKYLMPLKKWSKADRDLKYIESLEERVAKASTGDALS